MEDSHLKTLTARSIKWNIVDKLGQQLLYAVTGIVLARLLDQEAFGLIGAILVFQSFASLLVDSGFSFALIQRKDPTREDYSTVLWFNLGIATAIYAILFLCAPLIAKLFQDDQRLIPLSRVMFLSFILNASAIVQTNRLMKRMEVKMIAVSNAVGLALGGVVGIWLAVAGYGPWAIVWQTLTLNFTKSAVLWCTSGWLPLMRFSWQSLHSFTSVGMGMMAQSFLNVTFQNIYSFFIGNRAGLASLGYYTQADKWSKMSISSISQILTSSFLPVLSHVQDDRERFARVTSKTNRFTSYLLFPCMGFLALMATPIFHCLFGQKWDASIILFQLLLLRGIFTVLSSLYNNYVIALAHTKLVVAMETLRDIAALVFLLISLPFITLERHGNIVFGIEILLWGQIIASAISWGVMVIKSAPVSGRPAVSFLRDSAPYLVQTVVIMAIGWVWTLLVTDPWLLLLAQSATCVSLYIASNAILDSKIQREVFAFIKNKKIEQ